ncbi:MAG TPA: AgmX/PglI C-terminal domain-containing protein [Polyangia bacterium]|nr:AgmX/PglI C-terminal domain-containing protein [Polyangia bacterium]
MMRIVWSLGIWGVAMGLGCATKQAAERPPRQQEEVAEPEPGASEEAVPPEKLEEIEDIMRRKHHDVAHCWTDEASRTHNRNLVIDVMLKLTIGTRGRASEVEIVKDSISSKEFESCVTNLVRNFDFPFIPASKEITWQYTFKALY